MRLRALRLVVTGDGRHLPGDLFDAEEKEAARLVELAAAEPHAERAEADLSKMKKEELIEYAQSLGVELSGKEKKEELIALIEGYKESE